MNKEMGLSTDKNAKHRGNDQKKPLTHSAMLAFIRKSVVTGRKLGFTQMSGQIIEGYVIGIDSEYFEVAETPANIPHEDIFFGSEGFATTLVSRGMNSTIHVLNAVIEDEKCGPAIEAAQQKFKSWITENRPVSSSAPNAQAPRTNRPSNHTMPRNPAFSNQR